MIACNGIPHGLNKTVVLRVTEDNSVLNFFNDTISITTEKDAKLCSKWVLSNTSVIKSHQKGVSNVDSNFLDSLNDGDIVSITPNGNINVLWKINQDDNLLFLTDCCNSRCIMCPQTQVCNPENYYGIALKTLSLVKDNPKYLCISGGEPTFVRNDYISVVKEVNLLFPEIGLQVLTNGKNFADFDFCKQCVINSPIDTLYAIPLYSGNPTLHDSIVNSQGSFTKTLKGIINLYKLRQNIEIRIVVTKQNYKDLPNIAHFIFWNLPFVYRVAFMGMETHGAAEDNLEKVWVEPIEYIEYLQEAVLFLNNRRINAVIYNLPHCILPQELRKYAQDSISAWKKLLPEVCCGCKYENICSGVFTTSKQIPEGIHKI